MSSHRGHFKAADVHKLKERLNHQCSRRDCEAPTSGPSTRNSLFTVGTAAHICAASPRGPRFDPKQSMEKGNSIEKAISLRNICSREIDLDPKRFTIALLKQWKFDAAAFILGKHLPPSFDGENYIEDQFYFFSFIQLCRKITPLLSIEAKYRSQDHLSWDKYEDLELVLARLERKRVFNVRHFKKNITCIMTLPTENLSLLSTISETPRAFQITYPDRQIIKIFGEAVELLMLNGNVSNVFPKIVRMLKKNSKMANFEMEFLPVQEFSYSEVYEMDSQKH